MLNPGVQNRLGNFFEVEYPNYSSFDVLPQSIIIRQAMGKHDIVEIIYPPMGGSLLQGVKTGSPVKIMWGNDKVTETFFGYVADSAPKVTPNRHRTTKIRCVGASYLLKQGDNKIWTNKTASQIVEEIAKKFKLKPIVTGHPTIFAQQSLSGQSYWQKIKELGDKIGYGYQAIGTQLHFHPIDKMIDQFMTVIPVMSYNDPLFEPQNYFSANTLDRFEPIVGDYVERYKHNKTTKIIGGTDPVTGKPYRYSTSPTDIGKKIRKNVSNPIFQNVETGIVTGNAAVAISLAKAKAQLSRLSIPAHADAQGDPRIAPWRTVEVENTGSLTDGFWVVQEVTHRMNFNGTYSCEFVCLSDGTEMNVMGGTRPSKAGPVPTRNVANELITASEPTPRPTKLSSTASQIKETDTGFVLNPQRWI